MGEWMKKTKHIIKEFEDVKIYVNIHEIKSSNPKIKFGIRAWIKPHHWMLSPYETKEEAETRFVQLILEHSKSGVYYEKTLV